MVSLTTLIRSHLPAGYNPPFCARSSLVTVHLGSVIIITLVKDFCFYDSHELLLLGFLAGDNHCLQIAIHWYHTGGKYTTHPHLRNLHK